MTITQINAKITESHLNRKAIVYLRQSTEKQVQHNKESQRLQYTLKDIAKEWGWREIEIIDCDLGSSAAQGASRRLGFDMLIASVAIGEVGIIFSREASRLSRTDKDWCRLMEVCGLFGTLISDGEQIYNINCMDDQLLLGIKGTLSVVELKILKMRMLAGMEEKAKRGEFKKQLPAGYIWDKSGKIVKDPDERVQEAIELVFKKFSEIQSIRQTFLWFHSSSIQLPVTKDKAGGKEIVWQLPKNGYLKQILQNPTFAGVYVWGRQTVEQDYIDGRVVKRRVRKSDAKDAKIFIENNHEGYIDLDTFDANQEMIRKNCLSINGHEKRGAAREGQGVLVGILRCGRCGRKIYVAYYGKSGTAARYICRGDYGSGGKYCLAFGGSTVDKRFNKEILKVISPYGIEASVKAQEILLQKDDEREKYFNKKILQLEYEASHAFEQYNEVDPRNRLVAAELERRWNKKLEELEKAKKDLGKIEKEKYRLKEEEKRKIQTLGVRFPEVWHSEFCPNSLKKKIIRTVVEEVIVNLNEEDQMLKFIIHWKGGCHTELEMPKPPSGVGQKTSMEDLEIIRKMAVRYGDNEIARVLNKLGRKTATEKRWNEYRVRTIRGKYHIPGHIRTVENSEIMTLGQAARYLKISQTSIKNLVKRGVLKKSQSVPWAPWEIKKSDLDSEKIKKIVERLHNTGKLIIHEVDPGHQQSLFI